MPRDKLAPSTPNGVPTQADREPSAPPRKRRRGRVVTTQGPGRPRPLDTRAALGGGDSPAFQHPATTIQLPVLHGPSLASPAAQAVLRREFGIYEHPLPDDPGERLRVQSLARIYKARTGKNLLQQRDPRQAMIDLLRGQHERRGPRDIATGDRTFIGEQDRPVETRGIPSRGEPLFGGRPAISLTPRGGLNLQAGVNQDWVPGGNLPRLRMPGVFSGARGGNQFGGGKTLTADEIATPTPTHFQEAAENIQRLGGLKPRLTIPTSLFDDFGVMDAYASGRGLSDDEKQQIKDRFGDRGLFTPAQRIALINQAKTNGWSDEDVADLTDQDLIDKAYSNTGVGPGQRIATNFAKNVAQLGALPMGVVAAGSAAKQSIEQGSPDPAAEFIQEGFVDPTIQTLRHPWQSFQDDPLFTATTLSGAGRLVGGVLGRTALRGFLPGGVRTTQLHPDFNNPQTGQPMLIPRGAASRNAVIRPLQIAQDRLTRRSPTASGILNARTAIQGSSEAQHLGSLAGADRAAPLIKAVKGLSEKERMAAEWFALQGRDPANTIRVFQHKLAKDLDRDGAESPNAKYWKRQILLAEAARDALATIPSGKLDRIHRAASEIEAANQDDLVALGMSKETLDDRLWDLATREHPDFETKATQLRDESRADFADKALPLRDRANTLTQQANALIRRSKSKTARATGQAGRMRSEAADLLRQADEARAASHAVPRPLRAPGAREQAARDLRPDLTAQGLTPTMYGPHTPGQLGAGGRIRSGRPVVTSAEDLLGGRTEARNLSTYERGRVLPSPENFERAAGAPARARVTAEEMQRRVADQAGHKIDLPDEPSARNFDYDDDQWVVIQTGGTRHGTTRLDPRVNEKRQQELNDLMEAVDAGDAASAPELFRKTFRVAERNAKGHLDPGEYYAIPKATYEALERRATEMAGAGGGLAKITRGWRALTLNTLPRTVVNNTLGSIPLAAVGGAGPVSYARAIAAMRRGHLPGELRNVGLSGGNTRKIGWQKPGAKQAAGWMNLMRKGNVFGEDASRNAIYMRGAAKAANKAAGKKLLPGLRPLSEEAQQILDYWANNPGERPPNVEGFIRKSLDFAGDLASGKRLGETMELATKGAVKSLRDEQVALAVPFHQWYRHMIRLTLLTMPAKYPGRAIFLQNLAVVGDEYRKQHGVWPSWMRDMIPTGQRTDKVTMWDAQGEAQDVGSIVTEGVRTNSLNPFTTAGQLIGEGDNAFNTGLGVVSPVAQTPLELVTGKQIGGPMSFEPFQNEKGEDVKVGSGDWARVGANLFIGSIPLAKWATGLTDDVDVSEAATSLPWDQQEKRYAMPGGGGELPSRFKPRASSPGGLLPTLLRGVGVPLAQVDEAGPRTATSLRKQFNAAKGDYRRRAKRTPDG